MDIQIFPGRSAQNLTAADMEPGVVLRAFDDVTVELAVDQRGLFVGAEPVGGAESAVFGEDDDVAVARSEPDHPVMAHRIGRSGTHPGPSVDFLQDSVTAVG